MGLTCAIGRASKALAEPFHPELEEERYSGEQCRRCGVPLLDGEFRLCGGKNSDGLNCSARAARAHLAVTGIQSYATQLRLAQDEVV
jgi:hypothetical protein